ncbi:MAG: HNH endonuclease [Betaproteobacteria bacterium]|nr:HNH endonuclease [Betaproteobacteria bacterium]
MSSYKYIGRRYAHRVVYEQHFGAIPVGWVVHHKDEDKGNNDPANLEAMPKGQHQRLHATGRPSSELQKTFAAATLAALRTPKPASCRQCGVGFVSHSARDVGQFCSRDCLEVWRRNKFIPEQRACDVCKAEYTAVKRFQRYCCKACNGRSRFRTYRTNPTGGTPRRTLAECPNVQSEGGEGS